MRQQIPPEWLAEPRVGPAIRAVFPAVPAASSAPTDPEPVVETAERLARLVDQASELAGSPATKAGGCVYLAMIMHRTDITRPRAANAVGCSELSIGNWWRKVAEYAGECGEEELTDAEYHRVQTIRGKEWSTGGDQL